MKVLLLKDVYKLGRAGDVKKVADGYGRNYLIPQELATLATPGALKQVEQIRAQAAALRASLNQEMSGVAEQLQDLTLTFPARASETGKLYGSITTQNIAESIQNKLGVEIDRRQIETQPLRALGEHTVAVRLTVDLIPELQVIVYREGESPEAYRAEPEEIAAEAAAEVAEEAGYEAAQIETEPAGEVEEETGSSEAD